jgi:hydrogenase maturation protease
VVVGVGNDFRSDDGAGHAVVTRVAERAQRRPLPAGATLRTCDGEPARLLALWEGARAAVVVDAARTNAVPQPGRIHRLEGVGALARHSTAASSHGLGLTAAIELGRALGCLPPRLIVYTIEGGEFGFGTCLSPSVDAAVESAALHVEDEIRNLAREPEPDRDEG